MSKKAHPSSFHTNRRLHNWLIYDVNDRFLEKYTSNYNGVLYDLGCGEAPYKEFFLQYVDEYIGVDWTKTLHNSQADIVADLNKAIHVDDEVADTVISLSVMEHLCEPQAFLNEACRILKPEGTMIFQVPWQWWVHEAPHDYFRYTPYGLRYMFEKAGFNKVDVQAQAGFFTTWFLKLNYFSCRFIRGPRFLRLILKGLLLPFWTISQWLAPYLDKLDTNWSAEAPSYFVIASKD